MSTTVGVKKQFFLSSSLFSIIKWILKQIQKSYSQRNKNSKKLKNIFLSLPWSLQTDNVLGMLGNAG